MTSRASFYTLIAIAPLSWGGLLLFTYYVPPPASTASSLPFVVLFLITMVALTSTFAPLAYLAGTRLLSARYYHATMRAAIRQGSLIALAIMLNIIFYILNSWSIFMAIVILAAAAVVEMLFLAPK